MKLIPTTFKLDNRENYGFQPFRNDKDAWVFKRDVIAKPFIWNSGSAITFSIVEYSSSLESGITERELTCHTFYDKDNMEFKTDLDNLASGDLRGQGAEATCHHLFWKLFLFSDEMKQYLPEYVSDIEKLIKK